MKKLIVLALAAVSLTSCWTLILSEATTPTPVEPPKTYTTTVTTPSPKVTTVTTVVVTDYNTDPCFFLDLNAVAAAFAESRSVKEFEQLLNSSRYMINNLDLNKDGWVDYLRVIETHKGYYHTLLIQACLAPGVFQDVATIVAERQPDALYVEVIGDRYLYGYNYIVRPVFVKRPPMWDVYGRPTYAAWSSPYYYGAFPSYYTKPSPVYLNHYQAYVNTYMSNHHYCHHCDYPSQPHYNGYSEMVKPHSRNDYQVAHPDNSFERRTRSSGSNGATVRNAGQLRKEVEKSSAGTSRQSSTTSASSRTTTTTTSTSGRSGTSATSTPSGTSRQSSQSAQSGTTRTSSTTVNTRVNKSGTTRTTVKTTDSTGRTQTVKRESGSSTTRTSSTKSSQGTTSESSPRSTQRAR